jgi:hypothetical protein
VQSAECQGGGHSIQDNCRCTAPANFSLELGEGVSLKTFRFSGLKSVSNNLEICTSVGMSAFQATTGEARDSESSSARDRLPLTLVDMREPSRQSASMPRVSRLFIQIGELHENMMLPRKPATFIQIIPTGTKDTIIIAVKYVLAERIFFTSVSENPARYQLNSGRPRICKRRK